LHLIFVVPHRSLCDECAELLIVKVHLLQAMVMPDKQSPKFPIEEQGIKNRGFHTYRFTIYSMQIRRKCKYRSIAIHAFLADQILRFYIYIWQIAVGYAFIILHKGSRHEYWRKLHILQGLYMVIAVLRQYGAMAIFVYLKDSYTVVLNNTVDGFTY